MKKRIAVVLVALVLSISCIIGTTLAWLTDDTPVVKNTFTYGDITIDLTETDSDDTDSDADNNSYKMLPANVINKDPKVIVEKGSEKCYLFVKIVEKGEYPVTSTTDGSTTTIETYYFDDYIAYAIKDIYDETNNPTGWKIYGGEVDSINNHSKASQNDTIILYRIVDASNATDNITYNLLAAGQYTCSEVDGNPYTWTENQVLAKPCITKQMMEAIENNATNGVVNNPTLTFYAYAVQEANMDLADAYAIASASTYWNN